MYYSESLVGSSHVPVALPLINVIFFFFFFSFLVVAGSQAVPDDLQKIHSLSRELQQNQTQLTLKVSTISAQISNLSQQVLIFYQKTNCLSKIKYNYLIMFYVFY